VAGACRPDLARDPPALIVDTAAAGGAISRCTDAQLSGAQDLVTTKYHLVAVEDGVAIYAAIFKEALEVSGGEASEASGGEPECSPAAPTPGPGSGSGWARRTEGSATGTVNGHGHGRR